MFLQISILGSFIYIPRNVIAESKADPFLVIWGISILLSTVAAQVYIPTNSAKGFPFLTSPPALVVCWFIDDSHSDRYEILGISLWL